jgi:pimeloyl-ACP methyl ester carboxylesterase
MLPTIVLVHGAFAESSSWDRVIDPLLSAGHPVIAAANPLRGLASDAQAVSDVVRSVDGPVVLVGHSYGGMVISNVAADAGEITGLVYIAGFAPDTGETCFTLAGPSSGSTLGDALTPVPRSDGTTDLYLRQDRFHEQFAADVPTAMTARMAAAQRPVTQEALTEPSGDLPLWKEVPSWFLFGEVDVPVFEQVTTSGEAGDPAPVDVSTSAQEHDPFGVRPHRRVACGHGRVHDHVLRWSLAGCRGRAPSGDRQTA